MRRDALDAAQRRDRFEKLRVGAKRAGVDNALLFAGIASAETNLAHCWSEATWACPGPDTDACDGGPVIAGAADGPCEARQGGLGLFQFDAGDYDETLAREGERILTIEGSLAAAVAFMITRLRGSAYVDIASDEEALAFMNGVRVDAPSFDAWLSTVTHYYNGCSPERCSLFQRRFSNYEKHTLDVLDEMGEAYWYEAREEEDGGDDAGVADDAAPARDEPGMAATGGGMSGGVDDGRASDAVSCRAAGGAAPWWLLPLWLVAARRRRSVAMGAQRGGPALALAGSSQASPSSVRDTR